MKILLISGTMQSGKTIVRKLLNDYAFTCIVNPPIKEIDFDKLIDNNKNLALFFNIDNPIQAKNYIEFKNHLRFKNVVKSLFLDVNDEVLRRRLKEARRQHTYSEKGNTLINKELKNIYKFTNLVKAEADIIIDTSRLNPSQLRTKVTSLLGLKNFGELTFDFTSFGFKNGMITDADFVIDVRFLDNPFYYPELKYKTGLDKKVSDFVLNNKAAKKYVLGIINLLDISAPLYKRDNRTHVIVAIGCTGGEHRSVAIVEYLAKHYQKLGFQTLRSHRDISLRKKLK